MGTNYYHRSAICECCHRYEERHICKSLTSFEGTVEWPDEAPCAPVVTVGSWQDWKARILAEGEVWDEYGTHWPTADFIARVEATPDDARRRQHDWMVNNDPQRVSDGPAEGTEWLDADGFSFYGGAFS
jgi:hypothetical protein